MSEERRSSAALHLPDLSIEGFRGLAALNIPRLGRVTLLAGMNGVGKTTVLEACRVYAARGRYSVLSDLASEREEYSMVTNEGGDRMLTPNLAALFNGQNISQNPCIEIGPAKDEHGNRLRIEMSYPVEEHMDMLERYSPEILEDTDFRVLKTVFQGREHIIPRPFFVDERAVGKPKPFFRYRKARSFNAQNEPSPTMECVLLGPGLMQNEEVGTFWDRVALTEDEARAVDALRLVLGDAVERVAMLGDDELGSPGRRAVVKLVDHDRPVPLKSLGDGAVRLFGFALALANCRDGFLLIDEAENGIHYSVHTDFWRVILKTAHENNVQVLATTHGWDCIRGFAQAAMENNAAEGILVRLERKGGRVRAVEYSEDELETVAEQGIEVR